MADDVYKLAADFSPVDKAIDAATKAFIEMQSDVEDVFEEISTAAEESNDQIVEAADEAADGAISAYERIRQAAGVAFGGVTAAATAAWGAITGGASFVTGAISKAFGMILSPIKAVFSGIVGAAKGVVGFITGTFTRAIGLLKSAFSGVYDVVKDLLPLAGIGLFAGLSVGFKELQNTEQAFTRVKAAVAATGGVAGFTTEQLKAMADQMAVNTRFGDDLALAAQAIALQFKNVRGNEFKDALKLSADAAIAWGVDLSSATDKVFRALDDPLEGFRLLKSEGVKFSEQQKAAIQQMLLFGNAAGAQKIILDALRGSVGGQAAEDIKTFSGALAQINNAMGDAWKAISGALIPAIQPLIGWFKRGAEAMQQWAPVLSALVNDTIEWANKSSGVLAEWGKKAQEIFMKVFDFAVDAATRAFTLVQTAIQDFPGFMESAKAKFNLYWEEIKQFATRTWEQISVSIQNIWEKLMVQLAKGYVKFIAQLQRGVLGLKGGEFILGKNRQQVDAEEKLRLGALDRASGLVGKRKAKGQTKDEKDELDKLRKAADEAGAAFGEKFDENLKNNQASVNAFKQRIANLLGLDLSKVNLQGAESPDPRVFNKEATGETASSAGKFEDLLSLQKRITGAASQQSPETKELSKQTTYMILQHKETVANQKQLIAAVEKNKPKEQETGLAP